MEKKELKKILDNHVKWLKNKASGIKADLQDADLQNANLRYANLLHANLRYANLRYANLRHANLQNANLQDADLRYANLQYADLQDADLQYADLRNADWDFSAFPLWCSSFNMKVDDRLVTQLLGHIARLDHAGCSKDLQGFIKSIPKKYVNTICKRHSCVKKL